MDAEGWLKLPADIKDRWGRQSSNDAVSPEMSGLVNMASDYVKSASCGADIACCRQMC